MKVKKPVKTLLLLISFAVCLNAAVNHLNVVGRSLARFFGLLSPILIGFLMAFLLSIPVNALEKRIIKPHGKRALRLQKALQRPVSILVSVLMIVGAVGFISYTVIPNLFTSIHTLFTKMPHMIEDLKASVIPYREQIPEVVAWLEGLTIDWTGIESRIACFFQNDSSYASQMIDTVVSAAFSVFGQMFSMVIALIIAFTAVSQKEKLAEQAKNALYTFSQPARADAIAEYVCKIGRIFSSFISRQVLEAFILGMMVMVGMMIFRFPNVLAIRSLVMPMAFVPIVGAWVSAGVGAIMILTSAGVGKALGFILMIIVLQQIEGTLVGIGMGNPETRTLGMEKAVREADCLIGAKRMLESIDDGNKKVHIAIAAKDIVEYIRSSTERSFAVLLSGDTGFYSGAKSLLVELTNMEVEVLPGIGSLPYFCSRMQRPWQDVRPISLHGRDCDFVGEVRRNPAVFALVGGQDGVHSALQRLADAGLAHLTVHVGQRFGYSDEVICHGTVVELLDHQFDSLSVLLVENPDWKRYVVTHGLPDEAFDRDETPMTKSEVRAVSLSKLALTQGSIVYDIGSGSGSVSVECALQARCGKVYAIKMKEKAIALTRRNAKKFHLSNLEVIAGTAPEALEDLPAPTHTFIGGSTGNMRGIIDCLLKKNPSVRIVVNTVTLETLAELTEISKEFDFCDIAEVSINKPRLLGRYHLMTAQNPVFIFTLQNGGAKHV